MGTKHDARTRAFIECVDADETSAVRAAFHAELDKIAPGSEVSLSAMLERARKSDRRSQAREQAMLADAEHYFNT